MSDFIKRNAPVLIIGVVTLLVFIGIIVASQTKAAPIPAMQKVEEAVLVADHSYTLGNADAPVTIVEFSDFQCPACAFFYPYLKTYYEENKDIVRVVYRHFPLSIHPYARKAAEASEIAGKQGKFWEYAEILFKNQDALKREDLISYAERLGLNKEEFAKDLDSGTYTSIINTDLELTRQLGLSSTPTVFINGEKIVYTQFEELTAQMEEAVAPYKTAEPEPEIKPQTNAAPLNASEVDAQYGTVEITFDGTAFTPNTAPAYMEQLVRWKNNSTKELVIVNTSNKFEEIKDIVVAPQGTFEFRPQTDDVLTYEDRNTKAIGSVFVKRTN